MIQNLQDEIRWLRSELEQWWAWWLADGRSAQPHQNAPMVSVCKPIDYSKWDHLEEPLDSDKEIVEENEFVCSDAEEEDREELLDSDEEIAEESEFICSDAEEEEEEEDLGYGEYDDNELEQYEKQLVEPPNYDEEAAQTTLKSTLMLQLEEAGTSVAGTFEKALLAIPRASSGGEALLSLQEKMSQQHQTFVTKLRDTKLDEFDGVRAHQLADMIEAWRTDIVEHLNEVFSMDPG